MEYDHNDTTTEAQATTNNDDDTTTMTDTTQTHDDTDAQDDENTQTEEEERIEFLENEIDRLEDDITHVEGGISNAEEVMLDVSHAGINTAKMGASQKYDKEAEDVDHHGTRAESELNQFLNSAKSLKRDLEQTKDEMEEELEELQTETLKVDIYDLGDKLHEHFDPASQWYNVDVDTVYAVRDGDEIKLTENPSEDAEGLGTAAELVTTSPTSPTAPTQILEEYPELDTEAVYQSYRDDIKSGLVDEIQGYKVEAQH